VTETTYFRWQAEFGGMKTDQVKRPKQLEVKNARLRRAVSDPTLDKLILTEDARETSEPRPPPCLRRQGQRRGYPNGGSVRPRGQRRSTRCKPARGRVDEAALTADIIALAKTYDRYGYRRITALPHDAGWVVKRQTGPADLATGGAESRAEATETWSALAERRLVPALARGP